MKRLCITYQMENRDETAENCITTVFSDEIADDLMQNQRNSKYAAPLGDISIWLKLLAKMQGYQDAWLCLALPLAEEEAEL